MIDRPLPLKTIGLLGGSSNVATMEYYRFLNEGVNARLGGWEIAETLIAGMNFGNIEAMVRADDWPGLTAYMRGKVAALVAGGADLILCVSNTLHRPLEPIMRELPVPLLHIATPTGEAMRRAGMRRVALFGTRPVMASGDMAARWREGFGIEAISPTGAEQAEIDRIIFDELVKGEIRAASRGRYVEIAERMRREEGVEGLILGCTEIFLLIGQDDIPDLPMFDTARLHCEAAVAMALG
ncbi:aspartate/glutamate racemase family protein [Frigidibacter sp. MR17.24]|uniref:aspartate/glutamate racemase family protein n=1 Tax=Frigidibacter sp. MR17.24 TaxID=3127345 RepID=UPI003013090C